MRLKNIKNSNKEVALKCLNNSQESIDFLINEAKKYQVKHKAFQALYGISQNPDTGDYILVLIWTSGNEKIDDFIQETVWKDGPLYKEYSNSSYTRDSNKKVALKCLHNSQESIDFLINEAKKYLTKISKHKAFQVFYSSYTRNPNKEVALKCLHNSQESIDFLINETKKYPTKHKAFQVLDSNKEVALKYLHNSQNSVDLLINKTKNYLTKSKIFDRKYNYK
ncbi:kinase-like domain-containing protein [Rhizophagus irregularis DAOM 181602=DAOM 197198]|nr:kinase-like domain-containing protein [Rhizophagus irregularis DAOM 181602=DAOM 197198]